jgi:hypothetical protein
VIVVVGQPLYRESEAGVAVDGLPARIAMTAAAHGRSVQLVGKAGEDEAGDAVALALAKGGVGHVALLREAGMPTAWAVSSGRDATEAVTGASMPAVDVDHAEDDPPASESATQPAERGITLEAADIDLALRYLTDFTVLVLADPADADVVRVAAAAASWGNSRLIAVVPMGEVEPAGLPPDAIVFEAPDADPDGVFATMVGSFAAALDEGGDPADAFRSSVESSGWTPAPED